MINNSLYSYFYLKPKEGSTHVKFIAKNVIVITIIATTVIARKNTFL